MISYDFKGRVALVTGGTSGIGMAAARALADAGAGVVIAARNEDSGRRAEASLNGEDRSVYFVQTDVRDDTSVERMVSKTIERYGRLDFAVNSAGIGGDMGTIDRTSLAVWDDVMSTNVKGLFMSMRHETVAMQRSGGGAIVNICSVYGLAGKASHHAYVASKHAVLGLTRSVALETATRGIRVNAVCAGATRTPSMQQAETFAPDLVKALVDDHPMKRMATEEEIAHAALWLCSDASGFVTGAPISVDGGFIAA